MHVINCLFSERLWATYYINKQQNNEPLRWESLKDKSSQNTHPYNRYNHDGTFSYAWPGLVVHLPSLASVTKGRPPHDRYNTIPYIPVVQAPLRLPTATTHKGSLPIPFHSPFTYLPRQISIDLNAIETKYVQVPSWPLYHTVPTMSQCRVCIQMQAEQANWCKLLLVATPQPGGRTLHRKACLLWVCPRSTAAHLWTVVVLLFGTTYCCSIFPFHLYSQLFWLFWVLLPYHNMTVVLLRVLYYSFGMEYQL